jgi:hypothetical protein
MFARARESSHVRLFRLLYFRQETEEQQKRTVQGASDYEEGGAQVNCSSTSED